MCRSIWKSAGAPLALLLVCSGALFAQTIDFEAQCPSGPQSTGPCSSLFRNAGNEQTLSIATAIGTVTVQGGVLLDATTNLPADGTAVYGTATASIVPNVGTGLTNPLTITFPSNIHNFYLTVLNGLQSSANYTVADNVGNSATFTLIPNLSSGTSVIGFPASGNVVTITSLGTAGWDFFVDNINFNTTLPSGLNPISSTSGTAQAPAISPLSGALLVLGLGAIGWLALRSKAKAGALVILAFLLIPVSGYSADQVMGVKGTWQLRFNQSTVTLTIDRQNGHQFSGAITGDRLGGRISGTVQGMTLVFDRTPQGDPWPADDTGLQRQSFKVELVPSCGGCSMVARGAWSGYGQTAASNSSAGLAVSVERTR